MSAAVVTPFRQFFVTVRRVDRISLAFSRVTFPGDESLRGRIVPVRITRAGTWTLEGELVESPVTLA